jgi:hypothetical protein
MITVPSAIVVRVSYDLQVRTTESPSLAIALALRQSTNEQCASGQCGIASGECADPSTLVYVGMSAYGQSCTGPGSGTLTDPFCTLSQGLAYGASVGKTVVVWTNDYEEQIVLKRSYVSSNHIGVHAVGCDVTLDRDKIEDNKSGVLLESSDFSGLRTAEAPSGGIASYPPLPVDRSIARSLRRELRTSIKVAASIGLTMCWSNPALITASRSCCWPYPVSATRKMSFGPKTRRTRRATS